MRLFNCVLVVTASLAGSSAADEAFRVSTNGMRDLTPFLEKHVERTRFPAFAAAVVKGTNLVAGGAAGVRKIGGTNAVTIQDKFHIGSCTKSMTALLAVLLEQKGAVRLTNRVGDVLKDWNLPPSVNEITLEQLLQNRSGIGNKRNPEFWRKAFRDSGPPPEQRRRFLVGQLEAPLEAEPGTKYIYSNFGFALAGAILETAARRSWEELVQSEIFDPLELDSGGFGPPTKGEAVNHPWGHVWEDGKPRAVPPFDNPIAIAPAGTVHLSVLDAARYAAFHLAAAQGKIDRLNHYREILYSPPEGLDTTYAFGWNVQDRSWAGGKTLNHAGSNTMFYMIIWIAPAKDLAWVVATNVADRDDHVFTQCDRLVGELIREYTR